MKGIFYEGDIYQNRIGHIVSEIFRDGVYKPYFINKKDLVVIDIGANVGIFTLFASEYAKKIYSIEPATMHFQCLAHMIKFNNFKHVVPIQAAISNKDGVAPLFLNIPNKTSFNLTGLSDGKIPPEQVKTIRLDTLFEQEKIKHVDFMKVDIEGMEADVFCGDGFGNIADKVDTIVFERHSFNAMRRNPAQVNHALRQRGFKVERIPNQTELWVAKR